MEYFDLLVKYGTQSTYSGQESDSYAISQLLDGIAFLPSIVVS